MICKKTYNLEQRTSEPLNGDIVGLLHTLKIGTGAVSYKFFNKRKLLFAMLLVTNRCPYRCSYCQIPEREQRELSLDEVKIIIDQLAFAGTQVLALFGGEPLMREDIGDIVQYAKSKKLMVILDSTGFGVTENSDKISHLDKLVLSFDGPKEVCDRVKGKGSYESVMEAFTVAKEKKIEVSSFTVLTKDTINSIDFILDTAKKIGFLASFKIPHLNHILGKSREKHLAANEEYLSAMQKLIDEKKKGAPVAHSIKTLNALSQWPDFVKLSSKDKNKNQTCVAGKLYCCIDTDGNVYPCPGTVKTIAAKNFLTDRLQPAIDFAGKNKKCESCCISFLIDINTLLSLH